ncbi:hypothetical protein LJR143_000725 [Pseudoxanthomonas sp. LjRoot143]|uniref:hypothetical protein n=1 Tax=Pseudoxanthomonas sp. LjRoot143 TaxID=3342266 RepID=UPI003ECE7195
MSTRNVLIYVLLFLLIGTNALWWVAGRHQGATEGEVLSNAATSSNPDCYPDQVAWDISRRQMVPLIAAVQAAGADGASRQSIVDAVRRAADNPDAVRRKMVCMERDGVERVGAIGLQFDDHGRLRGATTVMCPY